MENVEEAYIREEPGGANLCLQLRLPSDPSIPIRGFRLQVNDSDLVAAISMEFESFTAFVTMFDVTRKPPYRDEWCSPDGDWKVQIDCNDAGTRTVISEVTSQLVYHPWFVRTSLQIEAKDFRKVCHDVRSFIGSYE